MNIDIDFTAYRDSIKAKKEDQKTLIFDPIRKKIFGIGTRRTCTTNGHTISHHRKAISKNTDKSGNGIKGQPPLKKMRHPGLQPKYGSAAIGGMQSSTSEDNRKHFRTNSPI